MRLAFVLLTAALFSTGAAAQQVSDSTAFLSAVRDKDGAVATRLLETGGSTVLGARNGEGDTALHIAVRRRDAGWVGFLLARGANPDLASRQGEPPLVLAARLGFFDGVQALLTAGAKVDAANRQGETALIAAVQSANTPGGRSVLPVVQRLLRAGANPDKTDSAAGYSAIDYARQDRRSAAILRALEESKAARASRGPGPAAAGPAPAPVAAATAHRQPVPRRTLQGLVRDADYPQAARAARQQGDTTVRLEIKADGRVQSCTVTGSSGHSILDASTCRILRSRARFEPATDAAGTPIAGSTAGRISWRLPGQ